MVRNRLPTTRKRGTDEDFAHGIKLVAKGVPLREAAEHVGITKSTLTCAVVKSKKALTDGKPPLATFQPRHGYNTVFTGGEEAQLEQYIIQASKIHAGLTKKMVREFAFEYAVELKKKCPPSWHKNKITGKE